MRRRSKRSLLGHEGEAEGPPLHSNSSGLSGSARSVMLLRKRRRRRRRCLWMCMHMITCVFVCVLAPN